MAALEARLGYRFRDAGRLTRALTHASFAHEHPPAAHNEALAFLGDAALALVVAERLFARDPDAPVGRLTTRRADLVSRATLARWAAALDLGPMLRLGRGAAATGGTARASVLAEALEALFGAIYLEGGLEALRGVVARLAGEGPW